METLQMMPNLSRRQRSRRTMRGMNKLHKIQNRAQKTPQNSQQRNKRKTRQENRQSKRNKQQDRRQLINDGLTTASKVLTKLVYDFVKTINLRKSATSFKQKSVIRGQLFIKRINLYMETFYGTLLQRFGQHDLELDPTPSNRCGVMEDSRQL